MYSYLDTPPEPLCRGTIVVDACSLYNLLTSSKQFHDPLFAEHRKWLVPHEDAPIPKKPIRYYIDILKFLARQGFKIVIPEMVGVEIGGVTKDGIDIHSHFSTPDYKKSIQYDRHLVNFLKKVCQHRYTNIEMVETPPPDHPEHFTHAPIRYLKDMKRVLHDYPEPSKESREAIISLHKKDRHNFGEMAIIGYLQHHNDLKHPVFVYSDDHNALEDVAIHCPNVAQLNTNGLFSALINQNIHLALGLRHDTSVSALKKDYEKQLQDAESKTRGASYQFIDNGSQNEKPFAATLAKLAACLQTHDAKQYIVSISGNTPPPIQPPQEPKKLASTLKPRRIRDALEAKVHKPNRNKGEVTGWDLY